MIGARDIRIGNIVNSYSLNRDDKDGCEAIITGITNSIIAYDSEKKWNHQDIKPILLTEEWLLKFKLERHDEVWTLVDEGWGIYLEKNIDNLWDVTINSEYSITSLKYVHQLQNLYFALTGKEL